MNPEDFQGRQKAAREVVRRLTYSDRCYKEKMARLERERTHKEMIEKLKKILND